MIKYWLRTISIYTQVTIYRQTQPNNRGQNMKCIFIMVEEEIKRRNNKKKIIILFFTD